MKPTFVFLMIAFFAHTSSVMGMNMPGEPTTCTPTVNSVELAAGTIVYLEMTETVESGRATVGQNIVFRASADVVVDDHVVIRTHAVAMGRVAAIEPTTFGHPEEITIEVISVQATDGTMIALHSGQQTFKGRYPNEQVTVQPGKKFTANVVNTTKIKF
jgi:hypothetical protein